MRINKIVTAFLLFASVNLMAQTRNSTKAIISEELLFPYQDEHVHASSIVMLPNGDLLATWYQGSGERTADDVNIM